MSKRDVTLDFAKGFLIILVVLGHSIQYSFGSEWLESKQFFDNIAFKTIYSFHMPLFMMISGFLFYHSNKKDFMPLMVSKLKAIGIPLLTFVLLCNAMRYCPMLIHGDILGIIQHYVTIVFCGMTMWYLLSILLNIAVIAILTRILKNKIALYLGMLIIFIASLFIPDTVLLGVHKFMFQFFCIGYIINQNSIPLYTSNKVLLVIATVLSVLAVCWFNHDTYIYTSGFCILGKFPEQILIDGKRMIIAIIVSYTFMQYCRLFSSRNSKLTNTILKLGKMSLFIYAMNIVFNLFSSKILSALSVNLEFNYFIPIIVTAVFILSCYFLYPLFDKAKLTRILFLGKQ